MDFANQFHSTKMNKPLNQKVPVLEVNSKGQFELVNPFFPSELVESWLSPKTDLMGKLMEELISYFSFRNIDSIKAYLFLQPKLIYLLGPNHDLIRGYFPTEKLILEVFHDPMDNEEELVIYIQTNLKPKSALNKLRNLNKERRRQDYYSNKLMVDVEFQ